jgi:non-specific protein-tyrosine kinase
MEIEPQTESIEIREYLRVLRERKWWAILTVVIVTATAIIASLLMTPIYQATATLLVKERPVPAALFGEYSPEVSIQPERNLQTHVKLLGLRPLAESVIQKLGLKVTPEEFLKMVKIEPLRQTNLINISVEHTDPALAASIANEMANQYITWSKETNLRELTQAREEIRAKLEETKSELEVVSREIAEIRAGGGTVSREKEARLEMLNNLYLILSEKYEGLRINEAMQEGGVELVSAAIVPDEPVKPRIKQNAILALVVGLMLGVGLAFFIEFLDNTIKTSQDVEKYLGLAALVRIPAHPRGKEDHQLVTLEDPMSPTSEAYKLLRASLQFLNYDGSLKSIVISSPLRGEGKTFVAANLAVALAQAGKRVILLGCDMRKPVLHRCFGISNKSGLTNVLTGQSTLEAELRPTSEDNLRVLDCGPIPPNPSELLSSSAMERVLKEAEQMADVVLIDTPPVLAVSDAIFLAEKADGTLLVVESGVVRRELAQEAKKRFEAVGKRLLGVVLNKVKVGGLGNYYNYYYYGSDKKSHKRGKGRKRASSR